jgi:hypothetical protein
VSPKAGPDGAEKRKKNSPTPAGNQNPAIQPVGSNPSVYRLSHPGSGKLKFRDNNLYLYRNGTSYCHSFSFLSVVEDNS